MTQAVPLGDKDGVPLLLVKVPQEYLEIFEKDAIAVEMNPAIFQVDYQASTLGLCFIQIRLNHSDEHIYTVRFDLSNPRQFDDAQALLGSEKYAVLVASDSAHEIVTVALDLQGLFNPKEVLAYTRSQLDSDVQDKVDAVTYAITQEASSIAGLWEHFEDVASIDKQWYSRIVIEG